MADIQWLDDYDEGLKRAKEEKRPLFLDFFKGVFEKFPRSAYAPEALYFRGVCRYLASHEVDHLKDDWTVLRRFYPGNQWAIKSNVL